LPLGLESLDWKDIAMPVLERYTTATPGSLIEEKTAAITWHHRMADPEFGARQSMELGRTLGKELESLPVEVLPGNKFLEVRMRGLHKGVIVKGLETAYGGLPPVLAMGDDLTDEDLFAALPPDGFAVHVGPRPSRAIYRLAGPAAARAFLSRLLDRG
jgi:trehalose 6-phosphate synthase/phosphatase